MVSVQVLSRQEQVDSVQLWVGSGQVESVQVLSGWG